MSVFDNRTPRGRGGNQVLAIDVAMKLFRESGLPVWFQLCPEARLRQAISTGLEAYLKEQTDPTVVARIAASNPGLPVQLEGSYLHVETWLKRLAAEVIFRIIMDVVGINAAYTEQGPGWIFLGRTFRDQAKLRGVPLLPGLTVDEHELVDLWGTPDGGLVMVMDDEGSDQEFLSHTIGYTLPDDSRIREAVRRIGLLSLPVPA